jgi:hypothetical protein
VWSSISSSADALLRHVDSFNFPFPRSRQLQVLSIHCPQGDVRLEVEVDHSHPMVCSALRADYCFYGSSVLVHSGIMVLSICPFVRFTKAALACFCEHTFRIYMRHRKPNTHCIVLAGTALYTCAELDR